MIGKIGANKEIIQIKNLIKEDIHMAYQRAYNQAAPSGISSQPTGKTEWVQLGVGWHKPAGGKLAFMAILNIDGQAIKVRGFHTDKSKSKSKNPSDFTLTVPKEELPNGMEELFANDQQQK